MSQELDQILSQEPKVEKEGKKREPKQKNTSIPGKIQEGVASEKFYRVVFSAKSNPNDVDDIMLACNGDQIILQREKEVLIAGRFLKIADCCEIPQIRHDTKKGYHIAGKVKKYPYTIISDNITAEEYWEERRANTEYAKKVRESAESK